MILESAFRRDLQRRFVDVASIATACFLAAAIASGQSISSVLYDTAVLAALLGLRVLVQRDAPGSSHLLLGFVLATTTLFDTGFHGQALLWMLHIPIALATWILVESPLGRALWLAAQALSIVLVNHTSLTPRLGKLDDTGFAPWNGHIQLVVAVVASLLIVRFLSRLQQNALSEARAQKRQAESASRAKDEFLSHMSHELRTPLNSIQGFADLSLQRAELPADLEENLRSIRQSADHLTHLVNDLLDLARLENGTVVLAKAPFSPGPCIEETLSLLRPQAQEKNLDLSWGDPTPLPRVVGDRVRWKQILLNLVGNAVKYTPSGRVAVAARWEETRPASGILTISVTDTGIGIAPEDQPKVFDRFHRLGGFAAPSGTGLGLPISAILAKAMGGRIALESRLGEGSTFTAEIPFPVADTGTAGQSSLSLSAPPHLAGTRVLLAEDNRLNIRLASQVLRQLKAEFDVAEDGGKALDLLRTRRYDLLLLDLHMPVKDGFEVARAIRDPESDIADKTIPILALTADAFEETRLRTREAGMDDFLSKPFRVVDLADRALRLVERSGSRTESVRPRGGDVPPT